MTEEIKVWATEPQDKIKECVLIYRMLKEETDSFKAKIDACKADLKVLIEQHGNYSDDDGYAQIVEPGERISYDAKALEALSASVPEAKEILKPHRKVTQPKSYLKVK